MGLFFSRLALALTAIRNRVTGGPTPADAWQAPGGSFWYLPGGVEVWNLPGA